jgi:two-component system, response regulator RegA
MGDRSLVPSVLAVDDDEILLKSYARDFSRLQLPIWCAADSATALALATQHLPTLALVDLRLGMESGLDLIEPIRRSSAECTIVIVSAYLSLASTTAAMQRGADAVFFKPVLAEEIAQRVGLIEADDFGDTNTPTLARAEWEHICRVLDDCDGNVSEAARRLGIHRQSLQRKLRKYSLSL